MTATGSWWAGPDDPVSGKHGFWRAIGFTPTAGQYEPLISTAGIRVFNGGRRTGKTTIWGVEDARALASGPNRVWIVGPAHELTERAWRVVAGYTWRSRDQYTRALWAPVAKSEAPGIRRVRFRWGAELIGLSAEQPDKSLLGEGVNLLHLTEAARISKRVWEEYLLPVVLDTHGAVVMDSTPRGENWFCDLHRDGQAGRHGVASWTRPSWSNTVKFPGGENDPKILLARARMSPEAFKQEIEASFVTFRGRVWPEYDRDRHGYYGEPPFRPGRVFGGVDWGYTHPAVLVVGGFDGMGRLVILAEWAESHKRLHEIVAAAKSLASTWGVEGWFAGPDQPGNIAEFNEAGLECWQADNERQAGRDCVGSLLRPGPDGAPMFRLSLDKAPTCSRAMDQFHYAERRGGLNDKDTDPHMEDQADAIRYLAFSAKQVFDPEGFEFPWL